MWAKQTYNKVCTWKHFFSLVSFWITHWRLVLAFIFPYKKKQPFFSREQLDSGDSNSLVHKTEPFTKFQSHIVIQLKPCIHQMLSLKLYNLNRLPHWLLYFKILRLHLSSIETGIWRQKPRTHQKTMSKIQFLRNMISQK